MERGTVNDRTREALCQLNEAIRRFEREDPSVRVEVKLQPLSIPDELDGIRTQLRLLVSLCKCAIDAEKDLERQALFGLEDVLGQMIKRLIDVEDEFARTSAPDRSTESPVERGPKPKEAGAGGGPAAGRN